MNILNLIIGNKPDHSTFDTGNKARIKHINKCTDETVPDVLNIELKAK